MAIEEQIFWLEIAIDDVMRMQIVQSKSDLGGIELGDRVGETLETCKRFAYWMSGLGRAILGLCELT